MAAPGESFIAGSSADDLNSYCSKRQYTITRQMQNKIPDFLGEEMFAIGIHFAHADCSRFPTTETFAHGTGSKRRRADCS
jgi:hypothetical protein